MTDTTEDITHALMLDGNAAAGMLEEIFGADMTVAPTECATCATVSEMGALRVFNQAPGMVMRCPACGEIMLCVVVTPTMVNIDLRGVATVRMRR
jgi:hypothetical protein